VYYTTGYTTRTVGLVQKDSPAYNVGIREGDVIVGYDGKEYMTVGSYPVLYVSKGKETTIEL